MKKTKFLFIVLLSILMTSCRLTDKVMQTYIEENSGILESEEYITLLQNQENGKVDENGFLIIKEEQAELQDGILVSFVSNNHFDINYYADSKHQIPLDDKIYLKPGDNIYADEPVIKNIIKTSYKFNYYEIYTYENSYKTTLKKVDNNSGLIYTIPDDYAGSSISICPLGEFVPYKLSFSVLIKEGRNLIPKISTWKLDNKELEGIEHSFIPNSDFTIECNYSDSDNKYYLLESNIIPSFHDDILGIVRFDNVIPTEQSQEYSVIIKEYTSIEFNNNKKDIIQSGINVWVKQNTDEFKLEKGKTNLGKFKAGDTITVKLEKGYTISQNGLSIKNINETPNGEIITIEVTENSPSFVSIGIEKKTTDILFSANYIKNGSILLTYSNGKTINLNDEINLDEKINITISPNNGYYITGNKVSDNVFKTSMKFSEYKKKINDIIDNHPIKKYISVTLDDNDKFGKCEYFYKNKLVKESVLNLKENDVIELKYTITNPEYKIEWAFPDYTYKKE